jgi:hypothetical protein
MISLLLPVFYLGDYTIHVFDSYPKQKKALESCEFAFEFQKFQNCIKMLVIVLELF